ncbi:type II secretion system F family protein [Deltaproteobacteria bacterium TL4]
MPIYEYKAKNESGETINGTVVCADLEALEEILDKEDLLLLDATEQSTAGGFLENLFGNRDDTLLFTIQMATGLPSGLPLLEIVDDLLEELEPSHFKKVLYNIKTNVKAGNTLADSLSLYPNYFNDVYRVIIRTGEESGQLDVVFQDLVTLLEWEKDLKKQMSKAMRFPITMLLMLTGLMVLVVTVVVPNFSDLFASSGKQLPGPTRFLLALSDFFKDYWALIIIFVVGTIALFKYVASTEGGRLRLDQLKINMPLFGPLNLKVSMSRFAHFWKMLSASGVDLVRTLEIVSEVVQNKSLERSIMTARQDIMNGKTMSESFKQTNAFPGLVLRMINLGETTGAIEKSLDKVAEYYDKEVPEAIESALAGFQPIMMLIMAGLLIVVAMAIMLPMFGMIEAVA